MIGNIFWKYFLMLLWLVYMLSAGIHLFSRGFLLSRTTQSQYSNCTKLEACMDSDNDLCVTPNRIDSMFKNLDEAAATYCLPKKSKVIILLIDALKYDFGLYDPALKKPQHYQNKLPILHKLLIEQPESTRFLKFIADPPTTTLQRLKGMTTGTLPTFIDVGSNFATPEINEDNLIDQIVRNNLTAVFMGDSTWVELFPKRFRREYPFPSFNIFDLDTVDNEIKKILPNELKQTDWDLLIGHFLGVDHCGHKYGPMHPEMERKLGEMNAVIEKTIVEMDDETTLYVLGDHGMTNTGDHGGETDDEVNALMFAYSKKNRFFLDPLVSAKAMRQIDLVPTLATVLGVPIPYSNLGAINYNLLPQTHMEPSDQFYLFHSWQNAWQVQRYLNGIDAKTLGLFDAEALAKSKDKFTVLSARAVGLVTNETKAVFHQDLHEYLREVLKICTDIWIKFDPSQMSQGLLIVSITTLFLCLIIFNLYSKFLEELLTVNMLLTIYVGSAVLAAVAYQFYRELFFGSPEQAVIMLTCGYGICILIGIVMSFWPIITDVMNINERFWNVVPRTLLLFSAAVFFSNSFVVQEQKILCYILMGVLVLYLYRIQKTNIRFDLKWKLKFSSILNSLFVKLAILTMVCLIVLRSSYSFFRCREEQGNCTGFDAKLPRSIKSGITDLRPSVMLAFYVTFVKLYLRSSDNLRGFSLHSFFANYCPIIGAVAIGGHFILTQSTDHGIKQTNIDALAWIVYGLVGAAILVMMIRPLLVHVKPYPPVDVPHIYHKIKSELNTNKTEDSDPLEEDKNYRIPMVYGLTTVYSAVLISFGSIVVLLVALLLGPNQTGGLLIAVITGIVILILSGILRYQTAITLERCLQPELITIIAWSLLAQFSFYSTAHQPTLSQIDWHAAFVGRQSLAGTDHSNYISAILVLFNTFGGPFIVFLFYPLLILVGPALYNKFPSLVPKPTLAAATVTAGGEKNPKKDFITNVLEHRHQFDITRGSLTLIENENVFLATVFSVGCKLLCVQGVRIFCSMLACTIHCRHLMVWKIFAPKFIYEGITCYFGFLAILLGFLVVARTHLAVTSLIRKISR